MVKVKSWYGTCILILVLGLVLGACGGGSGTDATDPAAESPPAETQTPTEEASEGIFEAEDMSLNPAAAQQRTDTIIVGMTAPKGVFNWLFYQTSYDNYVNRLIFDTLLEVDVDGTFKESLAEKVDVSEDGLKYTFHLKPGVKYSDGTPVTMNDYLFVMKVLHDPAYDGEHDMLSINIAGGKEYFEGNAQDISGIKIIDELTAEVTVTEPNAATRDVLGDVVLIPESYYGKDYKKGSLDSIKALSDKPIGSGQYILKQYVPGQQVVLEANPDYFRGAPKTKNVIYKTTTDGTNLSMLQTGETDMDNVTVTEDNVEELKSFGFLNVHIMPTNGYGYIAFNHKDEKFQDLKVRQALTIGLNREEIVQGVYGPYANVINIPQSTESWAYTTEGVEKYEFDMEKAKQLLDEAGWTVGADGIREKDGKKFKINFSATADNPVVDSLLPIMTNNYKELGIDLAAETLDFNAIMDKKDTGNFEMFFAAWSLTPDPDTTVYITNGAQNDIGYSNAKVDELTLAAKKELDHEKRKALYAELYQEINKDVPVIFMYQRRDMWPINGRLSGFELSPFKDFMYSMYSVSTAQ
ncbi:ABC transporter substrate-binding protein [Paenibacillus massiliensis]|uniref:ABC transporter substrate-binding protein n=1 Tax=Paenibacillus massiliensis TaxID=225917 RepID=UPI0004726148|nr:ABC transporter substrate-binding protein [Paenibacillus massiliensis]